MRKSPVRVSLMSGLVIGVVLSLISAVRLLVAAQAVRWFTPDDEIVFELFFSAVLVFLCGLQLGAQTRRYDVGALFGAVAGLVLTTFQILTGVVIMAFWPATYLYDTYLLPWRLGPGRPSFLELVIGAMPMMVIITVINTAVAAALGGLGGVVGAGLAGAFSPRGRHVPQ